jgi:sulfate transport system permease protein
MTAAVVPDPEAVRPELAPPSSELPETSPARAPGPPGGTSLQVGVATLWLSLIVLLPLAAIAWQAVGGGWQAFWLAVTSHAALESFKVTLTVSVVVTIINLVFGLATAWVLVRDDFVGKRFVNSVIDLPFALPTIVAGLTLLTLYGPQSPIDLNLAYTRKAVILALLFETMPFVIRSVQPVLLEMERDMEEAAASLGANRFVVFRRIILPTLMPAILSGGTLAFARAIGEYGSVVLLSGNVPFHTEVASVHIKSQIESDYTAGAAALSLVLLGASLLVLLTMNYLQRRGLRHAR